MITLSELEARLLTLQQNLADEDAGLIVVLLQIAKAWRTNPEPPVSLMDSLTKAHGNVWFSTDEVSNTVYDLLTRFRETVEWLGGMTVNERLVMFDLSARWDASSEAQRKILRAKLLAPE